MKKKIIFITQALWIGGIETALVNLLNYFDYDKYDVTLLLLRAELDMLEQINPKCRVLISDRERMLSFRNKYKFKKLYHLTEHSDNPSMFHRAMMWSVPIIRWIENRLYIHYIKNLMGKEEFDTAVIYSDVAGETAVRAVKANKYLMFYHHGAMRHVYHDKIAYKKCDKIIAVSKNQAEALKKFNPQYSNKVISIHNLTNVNGIRAKGMVPLDDNFDDKNFHIVSVGRVSHEKGMDLAVRVCAELISDGYTNIRWWIVGDGPAMQEVREAIVQLNMQGYVNLTGMKSNPYPYIQQADLYVQPSRYEGYPMTILEALILGQIVISTNNAGASEIIDDDNNGFLCPPDIRRIADVVEQLIRNPMKLKKIKRTVSQIDFVAQNQENLSALYKLL